MPPFYICRMCDKKMPTGKDPNTEIFLVKDKKGWYGKEWECRACYMARPVGPMTDRDGFRDKNSKKEVINIDIYKDGYRSRGYEGELNAISKAEREVGPDGLSEEEADKIYRNMTGHGD